MIGKVKVWHRTPDEVAAYLNGKGPLILGEPDEIREPTSLIIAPAGVNAASFANRKRDRLARSLESRLKGRPIITPAEYKRMRESGQSRKEIAKAYGIKYETLLQYVNRWSREHKL